MRTRAEEINVRVYKTEKSVIRRKAKKAGVSMSAYLRNLGTGVVIRAAPKDELRQAYQKLVRLKDELAGQEKYTDISSRLSEMEDLLLTACLDEKGDDETDGCDEDLGGA